ncbi:flagellar basal body stator protein MotB [Geomonas sp. Red276]
MARKKEHEKEPNHERWLVSYADFITLLFAVFVTLYAMSQSDKKKVEEVMQSLRESFGYSTSSPASKPAVIESGTISVIPSMHKISQLPRHGKSRGGEQDFKNTKASIEAYLMKAGAMGKVTVSITQRGLVVSLKEAGFFDSGSATLRPSSYTLLNDVISSLSSYSNSIRVEGHTDNQPISSRAFPSNWELSTSRATSVLQYLIRNGDFDPASISAAGYGEYRPVADNDTDEGRQKNRRVDIVLLSDQGQRNEP